MTKQQMMKDFFIEYVRSLLDGRTEQFSTLDSSECDFKVTIHYGPRYVASATIEDVLDDARNFVNRVLVLNDMTYRVFTDVRMESDASAMVNVAVRDIDV